MKITEEEGVWACLALLLALRVLLLAACLGWDGEGKGEGVEITEEENVSWKIKEEESV